ANAPICCSSPRISSGSATMRPMWPRWSITPRPAITCRNATAIPASNKPTGRIVDDRNIIMSRAHMLLVEDDAALAELLIWHFRKEDFDIAHTVDGEEALLLAQEHTPDI